MKRHAWQQLDQKTALAKLREVLINNQVTPNDFNEKLGRTTSYWVTFPFRGQDHTLAVLAQEINMRTDKDLFEVYQSQELASPEAMIESFCARLDRYLKGNDWDLPGINPPWLQKLMSCFARN